MAAEPAWERTWSARDPGDQGPVKIELDFTCLAIKLAYIKKSCFTLKRKDDRLCAPTGFFSV
jgi:hypothetical protein